MSLFVLQDKKGKLYTNTDLIDKITFVNFWFEACAPCIAEMKALETLNKNFKEHKNFQFWSITSENQEEIKRISKKYPMSYPIFSISQDLCYQLNFNRGFPTTIILNRKGEIAFIASGGPTDPVLAEENFKRDIYPIITRLI